MLIRFLFGLVFLVLVQPLIGQVVINEVVSLNTSGITDEDGEYSDWIELYNNSASTVNLEGFYLKDDLQDSVAWVFPAVLLHSHSYLLVFASGKDRKTYALNYKTIIRQGDVWQYVVPPSNLVVDKWRVPGFVATGWKTGASGFGYGDGDDQTVINPLSSIFIRKEFNIDDLDGLQEMLLHVDYDDGFIAFINGVPVAMENVFVPDNQDYNQVEFSGTDHEAQLYQGGLPSKYTIDLNSVELVEGKNVLALQGYNVGATSSDFTLNPFLTLGATNFGFSDVASFIETGKGSLHTNFKLKKEGEGLYLYSPGNALVDSIRIVELPADVSYGRFPDGNADMAYFNLPTPGESNSDPMGELRNDSISFSLPAGFYHGTINLELSPSPVNAIIKYTTDGSEPTRNSTEYEGSMSIGATTVIRAATFYGGAKSSPVFTKSYFINTEHTLPVFSITTDPSNLWDYNSGIYVLGPNAESANPNFGANFWEDWEKPVHLEMFDELKSEQLDQDAGVKITGMWSRANAQKSLALFARNEYGKGSFNTPLFKDLPFEKYESFTLRNSGNDWAYTMLRDGLASEIAKSLNVDRLEFQPAVLYINGAYWGIQNLREKSNEHYFESHYGVKEEDLNLLEIQNAPIHGSASSYLSIIDFLNKNNLIKVDNYNVVKSKVDIDCFIDYELMEIFIQNTDWPGNNIKYWNTTKQSSKWRWLLYDTDFGFDIWEGSTYRDNGLTFATAPSGPGWPNPPWSTFLLRKLLVNPEFKNQFINRMADLLNTTFSSEAIVNKLDSISTIVKPEIYAHRERWGHGNWDNKINVIRTFAQNRPMYVRQHFNDYFGLNDYTVTLRVSNEAEGQICVNTIRPDAYPFKGNYFGSTPVKFTAIPKPGYKFVKWENASISTDASITLTLSSNIQLKAVFEQARGDETIDLVINEINYNSNEEYNTGDWLEIYNNSNLTVDLTGFVLSDIADPAGYVFPEVTLLFPDTYLVVSDNVDKFKGIHPSVHNVIGNITFGFSRKGDEILLRDANHNVLDRVKYETTSPWPIEPFETAATLELKNPSYDNNRSDSWNAGPLGGTPGAPNQTRTAVQEPIADSDNISCYPTRFSDYTTLRIQVKGNQYYTFKIFDVQGRLINQLSGELSNDGTCYLDIFTEQELYPQGIYLIHVQTGAISKSIKVVKL